MFVVTIMMILDLQMSLKKKIMASAIFAVRLPYVRRSMLEALTDDI